MDDEEAARRYNSGFWSIGMSLSWMICRTAEAVMYAAKCDEPDAKGRFSPPSAYWALHIGPLEALRDPRARDPRLFPDIGGAMEALLRAVLDQSIYIRTMCSAKTGVEGEVRYPPNRYVAPPAQWNDGAAIFYDRQHGYVIYSRSTTFKYESIVPVYSPDSDRLFAVSSFIPVEGAPFWKNIVLCSRSVRSRFPGLSGPAKQAVLDRRWQALRLCEYIVREDPGRIVKYLNCLNLKCNNKSVNCKNISEMCVRCEKIDTELSMDSIAQEVAQATNISEEIAGVILRRAIEASERRGNASAANWRKKQRGGQPPKTSRRRRPT